LIHTKKVSVGNFLKRGDDFKDGDLLEVASEAKEVPGEFGVQKVFLMKIGKVEGNLAFNQTSINGMIDAYGENDVKWIGKPVKAWKIKQNVSGKFIDVWYFSHPDAELTENGFVLPVNKPTAGPDVKEEEIPIIDSDEGIDPKDIPY
jgi:hypothetical protein